MIGRVLIAAVAVQEWYSLVDFPGRFMASFPSKPAQTSEKTQLADQSVSKTTFQSTAGPATFRASYLDVPRAALQGQTADQLMSSMRKGTKTMDRMTLTDMAKGKVDGAPFLRFRTEIPESVVIVHQIVLSGDRLYHLMAIAPGQEFRKRGCVRFVESFRLTGQSQR